MNLCRYALLMDDKLGLLAPPTADPTVAAAFDELRTMLTLIKDDRNEKVAHEGCVSNAEFAEATRNVRRFAVSCVDKCGLFDAAWKERLDAMVAAVSVARFTVNNLDLPCRRLNDFIERSQRRAVTLTSLQGELIDTITEGYKLGIVRRRLIQAPSGSGKTIVCTRLVTRFIVDRWKAHSGKFFAATVPTNATAVLITHSVALVEESADAVAASLLRSTGFDACRKPMRECPLPGHGVAVHVAGCPELQVHVMTIDGFIKTVRARAASDTLLYNLAVVDEGHLVFSYQPHGWLDGQHECLDESEVREVLESVLVGQDSTATVVVVHDRDYQVNACRVCVHVHVCARARACACVRACVRALTPVNSVFVCQQDWREI
jgi:hypothetical protein